MRAAEWPRAHRYELDAEVLFRPVVGGPWTAGRSCNISRTGLLFAMPAPPPPIGARLDVILAMAEVAPCQTVRLRCHGKVVRIAGSDAAGRALVAITIEEYRFLPLHATPSDDAACWPAREEPAVVVRERSPVIEEA